MYTGPPASRTPSQSHGHRGCDTRPDSELQGPRTGHWERQRRPRRCLSTQRVLTKHLEDKLDNQRSGAKSPGLSHPHSPWETDSHSQVPQPPNVSPPPGLHPCSSLRPKPPSHPDGGRLLPLPRGCPAHNSPALRSIPLSCCAFLPSVRHCLPV